MPLLFLAPIIALLWALATLSIIYYYFARDLPDLTNVTNYRPNIVSSVYSRRGILIGEFYTERRIVIPLDRVPKVLIGAFIAAEDAQFFDHSGLNYWSIGRAAIANLRAGKVVQGGSTITQQVAKSLLLSHKKKLSRKIKEAILAYRIEKHLSKRDILFLYLNQIYLGHGAYGIEAAAENYFGKHAEELTLAEASILAGLPQAPSKYSPFRNPDRAKLRQKYVLNRMLEEGFIDLVQATDAYNQSISVLKRDASQIKEVPYFTEHIRRYLEDNYGDGRLYHDGLRVNTTVDLDIQKQAREALRWGLKNLDKRQGYRGPLEHLDDRESIKAMIGGLRKEMEGKGIEKGRIYTGVVLNVDSHRGEVGVHLGGGEGIIPSRHMRWARTPNPEVAYGTVRINDPRDVLRVGDVILAKVIKGPGEWVNDTCLLALEQVPEVEGAIVVMEPFTGLVRAMVGGYDFERSQFNRAVQALRQPGSAFKPVIYSAALDMGYTPATVIMDTPIIYPTENEFTWKPRNFTEKFYGPTTFMDALAYSRNVVTVKILRDIGVDYVIDYARNMGIKSPLNRDLSLALGSPSISLLELTTAYTVLCSKGKKVRPVTTLNIHDRDNKVIYDHEDLKKTKAFYAHEKVQSSRPSFTSTAMADPEDDDTQAISPQTAYIMTYLLKNVVEHGTGTRVKNLGRPAAGKTGTTDNFKDAWFIGYTPQLVAGVWVGFDEERPLGKYETGSRAASPIWLRFMEKAVKDLPTKDFESPPGIVFAKIDRRTGLLARPGSPNYIVEAFKEGTVPTKYAPDPNLPEPGKFFKMDMNME